MESTCKGKRYSTDLSDAESELIAALLPLAKQVGRKRQVNEREILNPIFSLLHNGCIWRDLPKDLPPWQTGYKHCRRWQRLGVWQLIHQTRRRQGRKQRVKPMTLQLKQLIANQSKRRKKGSQCAIAALPT